MSVTNFNNFTNSKVTQPLITYLTTTTDQNVSIVGKNLKSGKVLNFSEKKVSRNDDLLILSVLCFPDRGLIISTESEKIFMQRFREILKENEFDV